MLGARTWLCLFGVVVGGGCDLVVQPEQTTVLDNRGSVFAVRTPNAVSVLTDGTLVVQDADLFGLGRRVEQGDPFRPLPGAAIVSDGGRVLVRAGTVSGGNVLAVAQDPSTPPVQPPPGVPPSGPEVAPLPSALVARNSSLVEIDGGRLISGGLFGLSERYFVGPAVVVDETTLRIRGGEIRQGSTVVDVLSSNLALVATRSVVEISGGTFASGFVVLQSSVSSISGGSFPAGLALGFVPLAGTSRSSDRPGCTDLRGGSIPGLAVNSLDETLMIFGTGFNLPLGPLAPASSPPQPVDVTLVGTFRNDDTPFTMRLLAEDGSKVVLAPADARGCFLRR